MPQLIPTGPPDPRFLGDFLVYTFLENHFELTEEQFQQFASELPGELKDLTKLWTLFYLSWIFKMYAASKFGQRFSDQLVTQAAEGFQKAESMGLEGLDITFNFWLNRLDDSTSHIGTEVEGVEIPFEVYAAMAFLALDESSPYYKSTETDGVEIKLATAFSSAKDAALPLIQSSVDIGTSVEEVSSERLKSMAPALKMETLIESMLNHPEKLPEEIRRYTEFARDKFHPTYLEDTRKALIELEAESLKAGNPLIPLREALMTAADQAIIYAENLNIENEELRKRVYEKLSDIMEIDLKRIQPTTEMQLAGEVATYNFVAHVLRFYSHLKYGDGSENDWYPFYLEASRVRTRCFVEAFKKHLTSSEDRFEAIMLKPVNQLYKGIRECALTAPIQTPLYGSDIDEMLKNLRGLLGDENCEEIENDN
jgi:hypothetical protein